MLIDAQPPDRSLVGDVDHLGGGVGIAATSHPDTRWVGATSLAARPETTTAATSDPTSWAVDRA
jgi:hypothetical protein